jgi:murein DD-endopeptidase
MFAPMTPLHVIVALPIALVSLTAPARVAIETPEPPMPARIDSQRVLVYELHITSFARTPLELRRIEVLGRHAHTLAAYTDSALAALLEPVGGTHEPAHDAARLEPGRRVVAYLWVPVPREGGVPDTLLNRLVFSPADSAASPENETVAEQVVPVRHAEAVVLAPPLPEGIWLAGGGPSNDSPHRRALAALAGRTYIAQRFAIDWMLVGPNGDTHQGDATRNESYWGFDQPVLAVADGEVTEVVDSIADHPPHVLPGTVTLANIAGNHVILRIAPQRYVLYAHLEHGSVRVRPGERVRRGQTIAKLGDSGQTTAPHLHLHVADGNSVLGAEGVPWVLGSYEDLGSGNTFELNAHPDIPRERTLPGENEVVRWSSRRPS